MADQSKMASTLIVFLFTDLESSTRLWERHPEAMKKALERHDSILQSAVETTNGRVIKTTGDGLHAVFFSGLEGVQACIAAQSQLQEETWAETGALKVRMGLHMGEAQARGGDYYGPTVNRAARVMAAGHGGQVLLSAQIAGLVADLLPDEAQLQDLGEHRLKDLGRGEHIFQLTYPGLSSDFPPIASLSRRPNNLPTQTTTLIGRTAEMDHIMGLFEDENFRLLTLSGPGGTGKTRLALHAAADLIDQFPGGAFFVDLAQIQDPDAVLTAIARTIGLRESRDHSLFDGLKDQLGDQQLLLILDNFEQVMVAATLVADLIQHCPGLKIVVTSREALRLREEILFSIPPLSLPDANLSQLTADQLVQFEALQLFVERASRVKQGFELTTENARAVVEICRRLDGLPLAIELAAARVRLFSPQSLLDRLDSRLQVLRGGMRDLPERQQTLSDTIAWSYELLDEDEAKLFTILSAFTGFTVEAAEAVAGAVSEQADMRIDIIEGLFSLVDKSLLQTSDQPGGETRLWMLETIREFGSEKLAENSELSGAARQAHAGYYAGFSQDHWLRLTGQQRELAREEMASDIENIQTAWRYWSKRPDLEQLNKMVESLWLLFDASGWYSATIELANDLLSVLGSAPSSPERAEQEIMLQTSLARTLMAVKGYTPEVEKAYTRALELCDEYGEVPQLFPVLRGLASYYIYRADFDNGAQMGERILHLAELRDDRNMRVEAHLVLGSNLAFLNNIKLGLEHLEKGIAYFDPEQHRTHRYRIGSNPGVVCYTTSSFLLWMLGFPDRALKRAHKAMDLVQSLNHPFSTAYVLFHTGILHLWRREMEPAQKHAQTISMLAEEHEFQIWRALAAILSGAAEAGMGKVDEGLLKINQGLDLYHGLTTPPVFWPILLQIRAEAAAQAGKVADGLNLLEEALEITGSDEGDELMPQISLLQGDLLLALSKSNVSEARESYQRVFNMGQKLEARMFELLAATRLCRLEMVEGSGDRFARVLRQVYDGFTEGFSTADLVDARTLIGTLDRTNS